MPVETLLARIDTGAAPGEPHADEHVAAEADVGAAPEPRPPSLLAGRAAHRGGARTSTSTRCRARAVGAACASRTCSPPSRRTPATARPRRTSRGRTGPSPTPSEPEPVADAPRPRPAVPHAPGDRRAHAALAAHRGALHDDRGGGLLGGRSRAFHARADLPADRRALRDRRAARVPGAQRDLRGRPAGPPRRVNLGVAVSLGDRTASSCRSSTRRSTSPPRGWGNGSPIWPAAPARGR